LGDAVRTFNPPKVAGDRLARSKKAREVGRQGRPCEVLRLRVKVDLTDGGQRKEAAEEADWLRQLQEARLGGGERQTGKVG
jgi:hypothetical protein